MYIRDTGSLECFDQFLETKKARTLVLDTICSKCFSLRAKLAGGGQWSNICRIDKSRPRKVLLTKLQTISLRPLDGNPEPIPGLRSPLPPLCHGVFKTARTRIDCISRIDTDRHRMNRRRCYKFSSESSVSTFWKSRLHSLSICLHRVRWSIDNHRAAK